MSLSSANFSRMTAAIFASHSFEMILTCLPTAPFESSAEGLRRTKRCASMT